MMEIHARLIIYILARQVRQGWFLNPTFRLTIALFPDPSHGTHNCEKLPNLPPPFLLKISLRIWEKDYCLLVWRSNYMLLI